MILIACYNCSKVMRVDDLYDRFCKSGKASKKCTSCGKVNQVCYQIDGKIELSK